MKELASSVWGILAAAFAKHNASTNRYALASCVLCKPVLTALLDCRMIKLGLSIDEDVGEEGEDADEDLPPLEENVDEGSRMEEVD